VEATAIPVAAIVMGGVFLTAVAWKVLDLAMHAMSIDRAGDDDPEVAPGRARDQRDARR
jgi:hypothetical protein